VEVLSNESGDCREQGVDDGYQVFVGVGGGFDVVVKEGDGLVRDVVNVGGVVGSKGDQLVEGDPGVADG
jgi:hypothetical protein